MDLLTHALTTSPIQDARVPEPRGLPHHVPRVQRLEAEARKVVAEQLVELAVVRREVGAELRALDRQQLAAVVGAAPPAAGVASGVGERLGAARGGISRKILGMARVLRR